MLTGMNYTTRCLSRHPKGTLLRRQAVSGGGRAKQMQVAASYTGAAVKYISECTS
jgi:hypothetical protein